jgi:FtsH ternary system domain X5
LIEQEEAMSRAYKIRVKESVNQDLKASDEVCSDLEILEILPGDQMAELVAKELKARGFEEKDGKLVRTKDGVSVSVDAKSGEVTVKAEKGETVELETEKEGWGYDDIGPRASQMRKNLSEQAKAELERRSQRQQERLQGEATEELEGALAGVRKELNDAVNAVTREALKQKAAQIGEIKEMSEDPEAGTLTIKVEV